jgi:hypothetical protein
MHHLRVECRRDTRCLRLRLRVFPPPELSVSEPLPGDLFAVLRALRASPKESDAVFLPSGGDGVLMMTFSFTTM